MQPSRLIEETILNAWPCLHQILYDGWVVRFANGYSRRANSVSPIYPGALPVSNKIKRCEQLYAARQQRVIFKITPFVQPPNLDEQLAQAGYQKEAPTSVQTLTLSDLPSPNIDATRRWSDPAAAWIEQYTKMNQVAPENTPTLQAILQTIAPSTCFMSLQQQGQPVACGLGALDEPYLGLFDIVADLAQRGRGFGRDLMLNLLKWGEQQGATTAYLLVMLDNAPALRLYQKLGFKEAYRYWYRVKM